MGVCECCCNQQWSKRFSKAYRYFDVIVDAPAAAAVCFCKDPAAISEWRSQPVVCPAPGKNNCRDIFFLPAGAFWSILTCSYSYEEDERFCDFVVNSLSATSSVTSLKPEWNIVETTAARSGAFGYRLSRQAERWSFFFVGLRRQGDEGNNTSLFIQNKTSCHVPQRWIEAIKNDDAVFHFSNGRKTYWHFHFCRMTCSYYRQTLVYKKARCVNCVAIAELILITNTMTGLPLRALMFLIIMQIKKLHCNIYAGMI